MKLKLARLFQPRNPLFWLMLALNALSSALSWILHNHQLSGAATLVVGFFALANALLGIALALRLMRSGEDGASGRR